MNIMIKNLQITLMESEESYELSKMWSALFIFLNDGGLIDILANFVLFS